MSAHADAETIHEYSRRQREGDECTPRQEWPDPLDKAAYHGLTGEIVSAIEPHTEADPVALLMQLLVSFGNVIDSRAHFFAEDDRHTAAEYVALVGETARARKGTSWGRIRRLLFSIDEDWCTKRIDGGLSSGEGLVYAVRDRLEKLDKDGQPYIADEGVLDKRLLILEGEMASSLRVMRREGNTLSAVIRNAWDGRPLGTLTKNNPTRTTNAHISIIGHITIDELNRELTSTDAANGFGNRFLWCAVRRSKLLPEGGQQTDLTALTEPLRYAVDHAGFIIDQPVTRDADARALWREVYPELSEGKPGLLGSITARAEAHVARLSMIYALLDRSPVIRVEHLQAALAVWRYCIARPAHVTSSASDLETPPLTRSWRHCALTKTG